MFIIAGEIKYCPLCQANVEVTVELVSPKTKYIPEEYEYYCSRCGLPADEMEPKKDGVETYYIED